MDELQISLKAQSEKLIKAEAQSEKFSKSEKLKKAPKEIHVQPKETNEKQKHKTQIENL